MPTICDLDSLPFPARHLLKGKQGGNIFAYGKKYKPGETTVLSTSRGCPFSCSFCSSPHFTNNHVRFRSPKNVYAEVKGVVRNFGIRQFRISDDMFLANQKRVLEICDLIGPLDIAWRISTRVKPMVPDVYKAMKDAGCKEVSFGVESFDENVLKVLKKGSTPEENAYALEECAKLGISTRVLFMIRTPGQTEKTVEKNIEWLKVVPFDIICCTSFVPIPGSDIWLHPDDYNIEILNRNLDDYNFYFFGSNGPNDLKDIIKIKDRSLEELNDESLTFKQYLLETGKLNIG